jgi:hypothetical protein
MRFLLAKGLGDPGIDYYLADGGRNKEIISNCRYKVWFGFEEKEGEDANPLQTTTFFGMKKGFRVDNVDGGNPFCGWRGFRRGQVIS